jgi:hypothetical protein
LAGHDVTTAATEQIAAPVTQVTEPLPATWLRIRTPACHPMLAVGPTMDGEYPQHELPAAGSIPLQVSLGHP